TTRWEDGRPLGRSSKQTVRPCGRPSGVSGGPPGIRPVAGPHGRCPKAPAIAIRNRPSALPLPGPLFPAVRVTAAPPDVKTGPLAVRPPAPAPRHVSAMPGTGSSPHDHRHDRRSRGRNGGHGKGGEGEGDRLVDGE